MKFTINRTACLYILCMGMYFTNAGGQEQAKTNLNYSSFDVKISTVLKTLNQGKIEQLRATYFFIPHNNQQQHCISLKTFSWFGPSIFLLWYNRVSRLGP